MNEQEYEGTESGTLDDDHQEGDECTLGMDEHNDLILPSKVRPCQGVLEAPHVEPGLVAGVAVKTAFLLLNTDSQSQPLSDDIMYLSALQM